jgi:hypothetical protein
MNFKLFSGIEEIIKFPGGAEGILSCTNVIPAP